MDKSVKNSGIEGYLTARDAAAELGISYKSVQRHVKNGVLKAKKVGGVYFIPQAEIEHFKPRLSGRPRGSVPQWRFSPEGNRQVATSVEADLRAGVTEAAFEEALEAVKRNEEHLFVGTIARYVLSDEETPRRVQFLLIWRETVMPPPAEVEQALTALRATLAAVLDWQTARSSTQRVWMHT